MAETLEGQVGSRVGGEGLSVPAGMMP
jgi:hypothetical protein